MSACDVTLFEQLRMLCTTLHITTFVFFSVMNNGNSIYFLKFIFLRDANNLPLGQLSQWICMPQEANLIPSGQSPPLGLNYLTLKQKQVFVCIAVPDPTSGLQGPFPWHSRVPWYHVGQEWCTETCEKKFYFISLSSFRQKSSSWHPRFLTSNMN
jgi:hypothetical protein